MAPGDFFGKKPLLYVEDEKSYYEDEDNKSKLTIVIGKTQFYNKIGR
jgi:hypothetical protein